MGNAKVAGTVLNQRKESGLFSCRTLLIFLPEDETVSLRQPSRRQLVATILGGLFGWLFGSKAQAAERKKRIASSIGLAYHKTLLQGQAQQTQRVYDSEG